MSFVQKRNRGGHAWPNQPTVNSLLISYVFLYYLLHFGIMFLTMFTIASNVVRATCARCCDKSKTPLP